MTTLSTEWALLESALTITARSLVALCKDHDRDPMGGAAALSEDITEFLTKAVADALANQE